MDSKKVIALQPKFEKSAHVNSQKYKMWRSESVSQNSQFWKKQIDILNWFKRPEIIKNVSFEKRVSIKWFEDGELNVCYNCVDRHLPEKAADTAIIWEADHPETPPRKITYQELQTEIIRWANVYKKLGLKKGDRITIYMPMIPEAVFAMLASARIGAIHSVVFGGFAPDSIASRMKDAGSQFIVTTDFGFRGQKIIQLKNNVDEALQKLADPEAQVLVFRTQNENSPHKISFNPNSDRWFHEEVKSVSSECPCEVMNAEDPLFLLYTSGSTGKPKGVLHTSGGYLLYAAMTHKLVFDYQPGEVFWCTADVGWVTGHSYLVYGPLANGATSLMYEGVPHYPTPSRFWEVIDKHQVNIFYTAPTALRALMKEGDAFVSATQRTSLRVLGTVGEPINPEAWLWYHRVVGGGKLPIVDTWWQTETGGIMISAMPGAMDLKPGSAALPFFGVQPEILNQEGTVVSGAGEGVLVLADSWPGQMRTVYKDHARFEETYFSAYPGYYFTGDGCRRDEDGYYWITGRVDDVLNISGHRLGTNDVESALVSHPAVAEAAVVGFPHDIKGQGIYVFVTLKNGVQSSESLKQELIAWVRRDIGPIATPDLLQWAPGLPKTRSGKIMRRILRKIAENVFDGLGDISTLADPSVVENLITGRKEMK